MRYDRIFCIAIKPWQGPATSGYSFAFVCLHWKVSLAA
jgi:hypothetical protein